MFDSLASRWLPLATLALAACTSEGESSPAPSRPSQDASARAADAARPNKRDAASDAADASDAGADASADAGASVSAPLRPDAPTLCSRPASDAVRDVFCAEEAPRIGGLRDLLDLLGVSSSFDVGDVTAERLEEVLATFNIVDSLVVLGHSTALSGHSVSPINPRAIMLTAPAMVAFQRGVQKVEIISPDREDNGLNLYLIEFSQRCNEQPNGCRPGDLYTPRVENDWLEVSIRDDEDLKNTPQDCRQCHQRGIERPMVLIRELNGTWPHFFAADPVGAPPDPLPESGRDLVQDFLRAKGDEAYGSIPTWMFRMTSGFTLQSLSDTRQQPVIFDAPRIEEERWPSGPNGYGSKPQRSPTWDMAYEAFKRGEQLAMPHHSARPIDPAKQARLSDAYSRYRAGELSADELPDLADIFPDDPAARAEIGLATEADASPAEALIQACGACHNDVLDQTISRARFNIALSRMDRAQIERAIARIELAPNTEGVMPPPEARQLAEGAREKLIEYLRKGERSAEDDALLEHAAERGMRGGGYVRR